MTRKNRMTRQSHGGTVRVDQLLADIRGLILAARRAVVRSVDTLQVLTSFEIGRRIVEHEQQCAARAEYEKRTLGELAERLTEEFGRGFSRSNLNTCASCSWPIEIAFRGNPRWYLGNCNPSLMRNPRRYLGDRPPASHRCPGRVRRQVKREDEEPAIGIILCKKKHEALVTITLPKSANIYAREYRPIMGSSLVIIYLRKGGQGLKRGRAYVQGGLMAGWEKVLALQ
jgi:hypothetical protein